jgi:hypothetical protein
MVGLIPLAAIESLLTGDAAAAYGLKSLASRRRLQWVTCGCGGCSAGDTGTSGYPARARDYTRRAGPDAILLDEQGDGTMTLLRVCVVLHHTERTAARRKVSITNCAIEERIPATRLILMERKRGFGRP